MLKNIAFLILSLIMISVDANSFNSNEMNKTNETKTLYLSDYKSPEFTIESVILTIDLNETSTLVTNEMNIVRATGTNILAPLVLNGNNLELVEIKINQELLDSSEYSINNDSLTVPTNLENFTVSIKTRIYPQENTSLEGFYKAADNLYLTQCEPNGFRRITYFLDRPDIMTIYTTKIIADKKFPVLLSNGDMIEQGNLENNRHYATWHDNTKKPSYLFAMVIGDLKVREDSYTTRSGKKVSLKIFNDESDLPNTKYAMESLIASMRWDEKVYGLEYDLGTYMIVGTNKFNSGAMENKGLNIFNNKYILASPQTATDSNYEAVRGVIGHEYFHNWSGNRITLRDWFQLSLKEGFTVFRDQEFTGDEFSRTVKRIEDAKIIRSAQFLEDSGPLSHPVRPDSYVKIDNFYTLTVYNKGAEVIRMLKTIIGDEKFFNGARLYFKRHDGQAVTTEEFVKAMEEVSGIDLTQFRLWYTQSGTPIVDVVGQYDSKTKTYKLTLKQYNDNNPLHIRNLPFYIPIKVGLVGSKLSDPLEFNLNNKVTNEAVLILNEAQQTFKFTEVDEEPIPSLLRDFSAPIKINYPYNDDQLLFLLANDPNEFNRWDAGQQYFKKFLLETINKTNNKDSLKKSSRIANTISSLIQNKNLDKAFVSMAISLPSNSEIFNSLEGVDPIAIYNSKKNLLTFIGKSIAQELLGCYTKLSHDLASRAYSLTKHDIAIRSLKNSCLHYFAAGNKGEGEKLALTQLRSADNLTDTVAALVVLKDTDNQELYDSIFSEYYNQWKDNDLLLQKWLALQASADRKDTLQIVKKLEHSSVFDINTPNHVYSLLGSFISNYPIFHSIDGSGYELVANFIIKLDSINPKVAARMVKSLGNYKKLEPQRRHLMREALDKILNKPMLSEDTREMVESILK
jgi:aminopeptidase N